VASVKVHDALVLGADSMTQIFGSAPGIPGGVGVAKQYGHAQKLFQIGDLPIGVVVYGIGNIGPRSIGSFIVEFNRQQAQVPKTAVKDIATDLLTLLQREHHAAFGGLDLPQQPSLGVLVGGYSDKQVLAEEWEFVLPGDTAPRPVRPQDQFGAAWRGVAGWFNRLFFGIDPSYHQDLTQLGVQQQNLQATMQKYSMAVLFDGMPVQEAIDFVAFLLDTTINASKFHIGAPVCGGPLWVALLTPDKNKFRWIELIEPALRGGHHAAK